MIGFEYLRNEFDGPLPNQVLLRMGWRLVAPRAMVLPFQDAKCRININLHSPILRRGRKIESEVVDFLVIYRQALYVTMP